MIASFRVERGGQEYDSVVLGGESTNPNHPTNHPITLTHINCSGNTLVKYSV